jgi:hypothetical protein
LGQVWVSKNPKTVHIDGGILRQGPQTNETRLALAILAQQITRCLRNVVAGYRLPHPRLRQRAIGLLSSALDCSAMTIERLEREGRTEFRDFADVEVDWDVDLAIVLLAAREEGAMYALERELERKSREATS